MVESLGRAVTGHPILGTLEPVIDGARHVRLNRDKVRDVADWMAFEELPWPEFRSVLVPDGDDQDTMDFIFLTAAINFAFTDFTSHSTFKTEYRDTEWWDSDAMFACLKRAFDRASKDEDCGSWCFCRLSPYSIFNTVRCLSAKDQRLLPVSARRGAKEQQHGRHVRQQLDFGAARPHSGESSNDPSRCF